MMQGKDPELTLWHNENFLGNTCLQGAVEERIEHAVASIDCVVGLDVLLELDTAMLISVKDSSDDSRQRRVEYSKGTLCEI
ncbi:hypothetical protein EYC80_007613 [Monilinia laxa]|uniref:Uncharacterized protein n=1 Tax=Monilinia laxa TaxID=61186 RepID=A0A5N6JWG6_MONLA|nr:hypothetical protein EYC80_007613 [Monilinia laxa]